MPQASRTQSRSGDWRDLVLIICAAAALSIAFLNKPFSTRGEPREALVAQAMLNADNWILGAGYGGAVPSKPPFMHWFITSFSVFTGEVNEWTARLPSALASVLFAIGWFRFLRRRTDSETAVLSTLLLLTSVEWFRAATACRVDMILAVLLGAALMGLYSWWEQKLEGFPLWPSLAILGATLTKGPVGIVLPGLIFSIFLLQQGERPGRILGKCILLFLPAVAGSGLWYIVAYLERGPEFFWKVYYENFARLTGTQEDSPHSHSMFYLWGTVILGFFPWTILLVLHSIGLLKWIFAGPQGWKSWFKASAPFTRFAVIATVATIVFFSFPSSKRSVYLLPIYPFLAYGFASVLIKARYNERTATRVLVRLVTGVLSITGLFFFFLSGIFANLGSGATLQPSNEALLAQNLLGGLSDGTAPRETMLLYLFLSLCLVGALCTGGILKRARDLPIYITLLFVIGSGSIYMYWTHQLSGKELAYEASSVVPIVSPLHSYRHEFYGLSFYMGREISTIAKAPKSGSYVFLYEQDVPDFIEMLGSGQKAQFILKSQNSVDKAGRKVTLLRIRNA